MSVTLDEAKAYLRVDYDDEDELIQEMLSSSESIVADVSRLSKEEQEEYPTVMKIATLFTLGYLYEHREEADHHELVLSLRSLLFGIRKADF